MKVRISLLNIVFLLMFWAPSSLLFYIYIKSGYFSLQDDYCVQLIIITLVSFLTFLLLTTLDIFLNFWNKLNYWFRYLLLMGLYVLDWVLIIISSLYLIEKFGIHSGCQGGSPILMYALIIFYAPAGLILTLIAWGIKQVRQANHV